MDAILKVVGLQKTLGKAQVVKDLHLSIEQGEFITLLGPSGCGKSTTLNLIAGLLQPDAGSIYLRGKFVNLWEPRRRRVGMVFQSWALFPHMSVADNVAFGLRMHRLRAPEIRRRVTEMLALVRLPSVEDKYPSQLSGGMQQRVALARALATEPDILLLDEPLSNLDARLRKEMQAELKRIHSQLHVTTVFVTHSQEEALVMSDRIAVMNHGAILRIDRPEQLYRNPRSRFVCTFLGEANLFEGTVTSVHGEEAVIDTGRVSIRVGSGARADIGRRITVALRPESVSVRGTPSAAAENSLPGTVRQIVYRGEAVVYHLDVSGTELTALEYPKASGALPPGSRAYAEFEAAALSPIEDV